MRNISKKIHKEKILHFCTYIYLIVRPLLQKRFVEYFSVCIFIQVTRITGAFSYWESDIMRVNPFVVLVKCLPIAVTIINLTTAFIFGSACESYLPGHSSYLFVNCSGVMILNDNKDQNIRCEYS